MTVQLKTPVDEIAQTHFVKVIRCFLAIRTNINQKI